MTSSGRPSWWGGFFLLFAALLLVLSGTSRLRGSVVVIVLSSDAAPYEAAANEATRAIKGAACRRVLLRDVDDAVLSDAEVVLAVGSEAAMQMHRRSESPLVYCMASGDVSDALDRRHGVSVDVDLATQMNLIREALPRARRVGMLHAPDQDDLIATVRESMPEGMTLVAAEVEGPAKLMPAIESLFDRDVDIIWTRADRTIYTGPAVKTILKEAIRHEVPVFGFSPGFVKAGALLGVAIDPRTQGRQAGGLVDLVRDTPAISVQRVEPEYDVALNLVVADRLSIDLPRRLVDRAGTVFGKD